MYMDLEFEDQTTFLVTGGAGFIGSNLCEAILDAGYGVKCLDNFSTGKEENIEAFSENPRFTLLNGDIRDMDTCIDACRGVDFVLHQAACGSVPGSIEKPLYYEEVNIRGTLNMMEAARRTKVKKFVYASSSSVYGDLVSPLQKEGSEGNPLSPYALTKKADEGFARLYFLLYGLRTVGLRYFNVFGKRQDPNGPYAAVIPKFIGQLIEDRAPTIDGDGMQSRDFIYVGDVAQANLRACLAPEEADGGLFNIAFGNKATILDLYETISGLLQKDIRPAFGPVRPGDIRHSNADITRAKTLLGFAPRYSLSEGLKPTVEWFEKHRI